MIRSAKRSRTSFKPNTPPLPVDDDEISDPTLSADNWTERYMVPRTDVRLAKVAQMTNNEVIAIVGTLLGGLMVMMTLYAAFFIRAVGR